MIGSRRRRRTRPFCTILHFLPLEPLARSPSLARSIGVGDLEENCSIAAAAVEPPLNACSPSVRATRRRSERENEESIMESFGVFCVPYFDCGSPYPTRIAGSLRGSFIIPMTYLGAAAAAIYDLPEMSRRRGVRALSMLGPVSFMELPLDASAQITRPSCLDITPF